MIAVSISEIFHLKLKINREDRVIKMYCLTAKNRITKRWEDIEYFKDDRQFDFMIDSVDYNKYSESMILDENHHCLRHYEKKNYEPYFKEQTISKSLCKKKNQKIGSIKIWGIQK